MITENVLRVKLEATSDGSLKATLGGAAQGLAAVDEAQQNTATTATTTTGALRDEAAAATALGESAAETEARIKAMVQASLARQRAELDALGATQRNTALTAEQSDELARLVQSQTRVMHGATDMVRAEEKATAAAANTAGLEKQRAELGKLVGQIDPTVAALEKLDAQQAKLDRFRAQGVLGADDYRMFSAVIDQGRERIAAASNAMHEFGLNNAMVRRELGYLVKDLATGQYGRLSQSALTLATNTGLMGAAFSASGVAVLGTSALLAAFGLAALEAYRDEQQLNQALAQTGNFAGITMGQIDGMADSMGAANGKVGEARDILLALSANGKVGRDSFTALGQAAVDMAELTGQSADKVAATVVQMFDGTVAGALKANEQYHYLTDAAYDRIRALEEEGRAQEAAQVAAEAFHDAVGPRIEEMRSQVYGLAAAWDEVTASTRGWWDQFKQGAALIAGTADVSARYYAQMARVQESYRRGGSPSASERAKLDSLKAEMDAATDRADREAVQRRLADDSVNASAAIDRITNSVDRTDTAKRKLAELTSAYEKLWASASPDNARLADVQRLVNDDGSVSFSGGSYDRLKADIEKKYTPKPTRKPRSREPAAYDVFSRQVDALDRNTIQADTDAMTEYQQGIAKLAADMDVYLQKGGDATKAAAEFNRGQQALQRTLDDNHRRELEGQREYKAALEERNAALQRSIDNQIASISMGDREYQRTQQIARAYRDEAEQLQKLALQRQAGMDGRKGGLSQSAYEADVEALRVATEQKLAIIKEGYAREDEAMADWHNGAISAMENWRDTAADVAGQVEDLVTHAANSMSEAFVQFALTGKLSFKDFANSVIEDLARIMYRRAIAGIFDAVLGAYGGSVGSRTSYGIDGSLLTSSNGYGLGGPGSGGYGMMLDGHAEGGKITGPGTGTSDSVLIRASNGEYMQPADTVNYYGERFMDDVRAKRLPRYAAGGMIGGGSAAAGVPQVQVNITNNGQAVQAQQTGARMDGSKLIIDLVLQAVQSDIAKGGGTAQAMQQRFGLQRRGTPVSGA